MDEERGEDAPPLAVDDGGAKVSARLEQLGDRGFDRRYVEPDLDREADDDQRDQQRGDPGARSEPLEECRDRNRRGGLVGLGS